ncbi:16S rRNA (guanine(527)-N(7))-methyltransferase RsmG [Aureispira anguillae]|uniref:Ribosomal RNA small subunit methyltransferase G n=1 Tax=Aureispira anguillae TaxID=2864201 RepID=A0A915YIW2_9BACT|nr:16S rRNA (guanine(527)-N(7))-methyltransferase RsmG [Aureispira anguillae]BDS13875.1 16S rRNA (guanine(527)-N(7))-methyltransferase RsmG [Aureispira anguillae]
MNTILKYFPDLNPTQIDQLSQLGALYADWNSKINVISRKDIDNIYVRHVLHSMSLAKIFQFKDGSKVMDLGTGGGFPGIPLAILFPNVDFLLVDSIGKKVRVTEEVARAVGLKNVRTQQIRAEELKEKFDFVVTRAVAVLPQLVRWTHRVISDKHQHGTPNGIWALKGIDRAKEEAKALGNNAYTEIYPMKELFEEEFFETKCIVYAQK